MAREIVHQFEIAQDSRPLSSDEFGLCCLLKKHSLGLSSLLRTVARLRSRIDWIREGDANTNLFHLHARHRKRKNFIPKLVVDNQVFTKQEDKAQAVFDFYNNLLGTAENRDFSINLEHVELSQHDLEDFEIPFSKEEVWATIKELPSDKAPGPDGFTGRFYKTCWPIIKDDILVALVAVQLGDFRHLRLLNSAYITLIPKKEEALQARDFRPISLIHSFAKLLTKLLANRLARKLQDLVATNQSAFVKGRCIHDNFMLVQQTARYLHQQKLPRILLKLDIAKAFDSVSWSFLLEVLRHRGFGPGWRNLICGILYTSSTRVLTNGSPGEEIQHQ